MFTDGRQQRQPYHNTTIYCVSWRTTRTTQSWHDHIYYVYWRTKTTINPIIIRPHIMFTDGRQQRQPNHNTTIYCSHMKHDVKKHSYNYQFHVMLFWSLFLHVSQSESYLSLDSQQIRYLKFVPAKFDSICVNDSD